MPRDGDTRLSKFLSLVLRHEPKTAGITLDPAGWVDVDALLAGAQAANIPITRADLERIVEESDKQRFSSSHCGNRIRAAQGHSVPVDLGLVPQSPPDVLWHGTAQRSLRSILSEGLRPGSRQHVHLSRDADTARVVGARHGKPVILRVAAGDAHNAGQRFWCADNGVWLTDPLDPEYLSLQDEP